MQSQPPSEPRLTPTPTGISTRSGPAPFRSHSVWMPIAVVGLFLTVAANLYQMPAELERIDIIGRLLTGEATAVAEVRDNDAAIQTRAQLSLVALAVAGVVFLVWTYRAYGNLATIGAKDLSFSPRSAVLAWLIPIMWLFRPYQVMSDLWRASAGMRGGAWKLLDNSRLIGFWWALWLIAGWIGNFAFQDALREPRSLSALRNYSYFVLVDDALLIPAALMAAVLVWQISRRQTAAWSLAGVPADASRKFDVGLGVGASLTAAALVAAIFAVDLPLTGNNDGVQSSSPTATRTGRSLMSDAPQILDVQGSLPPGFTRVDAARFGFSRQALGLNASFSEVVAYQSDSQTQLLYGYMNETRGAPNIAVSRAYIRDEAAMEKDFWSGYTGNSGPPKMSWSDPGIGSESRIGTFVFVSQGVDVVADFLIFLEVRDDQAAVVYLFSLRQASSLRMADINEVGRAVAANINRWWL